MSFIAGCIDGDGSFSYYWRRNSKGKYKTPRITVSSNSVKFLTDIQHLLESFEITSKINYDRKCRYKLNVLGAGDCVRLFSLLFPFLNHNEKKKHFINILSDKQLLNVLRVSNGGKILNKWKKETGLNWKKFSKIIEEYCCYKISPSTASNWGYNCFRAPLLTIITACEKTGEKIGDWLPAEYVFLLSIRAK